MKLRTFPTLLMMLLAATIATTQPSSATAPAGPSASGQGGFAFFNVFREVPQFEQWEFSFDAKANKQGHARGRAIFTISETEVVVKIDCLEVQGSSEFASAIMTGTVLHSDNPNYPKRANVVFAAVDNSGSPIFRQDIITPLFVFSPGFANDCHDIGSPLTMFQVGDSITIEP